MRKNILILAMLLVAAAMSGVAQTDSCVITSVPQTWGFESGNTGGTL